MSDFAYDGKTGLFRYVRYGRLGLIVWKRVNAMSDDEFREHVEAVDRAAQAIGSAQVACVNHTTTFSPTAQQRVILSNEKHKMRAEALEALAMITGSPLIRGAVTALSWMARMDYRIKAFAPSGYAQAFEWCRSFTPFEIEPVVSDYLSIVNEVGG